MKHIHLIGIGGTGLSAIARVLLEKGYTVSGSDRASSALFEAIRAAGAITFIGHDADHIKGADLIVRSSAIAEDNPEVQAALQQGIPVLKRADFLGQLMDDLMPLAVAGTHGKTTTTAMLAWVLHQLGQDPSYILGGVISQLNRNAHAGSGAFFVIEADEYDHMFLGLNPYIEIIINIEHDHPDCFPTMQDYLQAFLAFVNRLQNFGRALVCLDDAGVQKLVAALPQAQNLLTYGLSEDAQYQATGLTLTPQGFPQFTATFTNTDGRQETLGTVTLGIPGEHNVLNALAVLAVIHQLELPLPQAINALAKFSGAGRRFELVDTVNGTVFIDDYGHHPTEIRATLRAARQRFAEKRIIAIWEPHTYSRTQSLMANFIMALHEADHVIITKIYAAREAQNAFTPQAIVDAMPKGHAEYLEDFSIICEKLAAGLSPNDVVIVFSAGDAPQITRRTIKMMKEARAK